MALPKLESPIFQANHLGSEKTYDYRPFRTSEQKALLISAESGEDKDIIRGLVALVTACTYNKIDWMKQPIVNFENAFLNIRSKSIGEIVDMVFKCNADGCGFKNEIRVDVREASHEPFPETIIKVNDSISICLEGLLVEDLLKEDTDIIMLDKVKYIIEDDEVISEFSKAELSEFIDSLPPTISEEIRLFFKKQPVLELNIPTCCSSCGTKSKIVLKGVLNFFG